MVVKGPWLYGSEGALAAAIKYTNNYYRQFLNI